MCCRPDVAVVTNLSPNHLDVHPDYADYARAKKNIFLRQGPEDRLVLNADNADVAPWAAEAKGEVLFFSRRSLPERGYGFREGWVYRNGERFLSREELLLPGDHNVENYMAAFAATDGLVSLETCRKVAGSFPGVPHRIELVRTLRGVKYYNDSIGSSPTRTIAGLRSFPEKVILIAGGHDKLVPFDLLAEEINRNVKGLFLVGETAEKIRAAVCAVPGYDPERLPVTVLTNLRDTVAVAGEGDTVLFSPACSSFDQFRNFVERGEAFRRFVQELE